MQHHINKITPPYNLHLQQLAKSMVLLQNNKCSSVLELWIGLDRNPAVRWLTLVVARCTTAVHTKLISILTDPSPQALENSGWCLLFLSVEQEKRLVRLGKICCGPHFVGSIPTQPYRPRANCIAYHLLFRLIWSIKSNLRKKALSRMSLPMRMRFDVNYLRENCNTICTTLSVGAFRARNSNPRSTVRAGFAKQ